MLGGDDEVAPEGEPGVAGVGLAGEEVVEEGIELAGVELVLEGSGGEFVGGGADSGGVGVVGEEGEEVGGEFGVVGCAGEEEGDRQSSGEEADGEG